MKKPNIVMMVADDHGLETLGCYGNPVVKTPHLDALAEDGQRFVNAFCTTASCSASRSVILTGLHNHTNGTFGHVHTYHHFSCFDDILTLPRMLKNVGYRTGRAGKKHYAPEVIFPFDFHAQDTGRHDIQLAKNCREFLIDESEAPFFLYWCSHNPHRCGRELGADKFNANCFGNPPETFPDDTEEYYSSEEVIVPSFLNDDAATREELAQYYQSVSRLDRGVGQLIKELKAAGVYDNTLIIYISDNGAAFPASKTTLYESGMRLPCIIKTPQATKRNGLQEYLISWADLTPTILEYAQNKTDISYMPGESIMDVLEGHSEGRPDKEIFASHSFHEITNYYPMRVIRTKRYKFIWNIAHPLTYSFASDLWESAAWQAALNQEKKMLGRRRVEAFLHRDKFELYDVINDQDEVNNLANDSSQEELVAEFCEKLKRYQLETKDPWLHKWEYE